MLSPQPVLPLAHTRAPARVPARARVRPRARGDLVWTRGRKAKVRRGPSGPARGPGGVTGRQACGTITTSCVHARA